MTKVSDVIRSMNDEQLARFLAYYASHDVSWRADVSEVENYLKTDIGEKLICKLL